MREAMHIEEQGAYGKFCFPLSFVVNLKLLQKTKFYKKKSKHNMESWMPSGHRIKTLGKK